MKIGLREFRTSGTIMTVKKTEINNGSSVSRVRKIRNQRLLGDAVTKEMFDNYLTERSVTPLDLL